MLHCAEGRHFPFCFIWQLCWIGLKDDCERIEIPSVYSHLPACFSEASHLEMTMHFSLTRLTVTLPAKLRVV